MEGLLKQGLVGLGMSFGLVVAPQGGALAQQPGSPVVFTEPSPLDFGDHQGYVSLFDGVSLKGWDGNPKFWRVEDGAIVGESTAAEPERQQLSRVSRSSKRKTSL